MSIWQVAGSLCPALAQIDRTKRKDEAQKFVTDRAGEILEKIVADGGKLDGLSPCWALEQAASEWLKGGK